MQRVPPPLKYTTTAASHITTRTQHVPAQRSAFSVRPYHFIIMHVRKRWNGRDRHFFHSKSGYFFLFFLFLSLPSASASFLFNFIFIGWNVWLHNAFYFFRFYTLDDEFSDRKTVFIIRYWPRLHSIMIWLHTHSNPRAAIRTNSALEQCDHRR